MFFRTWRCPFFTLDYCYKNNSAIFHKNFSIFFYFLYESRKPLYKIFRDIENFYLKYPEAGFLLQNITEMRI